MRCRNLLQWLIYSAGILASAAMPMGISRAMTPSAEADRRKHPRPPGALRDDSALSHHVSVAVFALKPVHTLVYQSGSSNDPRVHMFNIM
jgi:hypothetical protein